MSTTSSITPIPSWGWALRRALIWLGLMVVITAVAALLAHASIDPTLEQGPTPASIGIGSPAKGILGR